MIKTDIVKVYEDFCNFTTKEMKKSIKGAIGFCGRKLVKIVRQNLRSSLRKTNVVNPKYNDTLEQGVRMGKVREDKEYGLNTIVRITSTRDRGSGSFRLHILEKGSFKTGERFVKTYKGKPLKKPRSAGRLRGYFFFGPARDSFEGEYKTIMEDAISRQVEKINNKKFGK